MTNGGRREKCSSRLPEGCKKPALFVATLALLGGALTFLPATPAGDATGSGTLAVPGKPPAVEAVGPVVLSPAAKKVAASWVETYVSSSASASRGRGLQNLRRYSSRELIRQMSLSSGAPAFVRRQAIKRKPVAEIEAVHLEDGPVAGPSVVVIYERKTFGSGGRSGELRTSTLRLRRTPSGWKVSEVLVP